MINMENCCSVTSDRKPPFLGLGLGFGIVLSFGWV